MIPMVIVLWKLSVLRLCWWPTSPQIPLNYTPKSTKITYLVYAHKWHLLSWKQWYHHCQFHRCRFEFCQNWGWTMWTKPIPVLDSVWLHLGLRLGWKCNHSYCWCWYQFSKLCVRNSKCACSRYNLSTIDFDLDFIFGSISLPFDETVDVDTFRLTIQGGNYKT